MGLSHPKYPVPGTDLSGVVEALGPGVTEFDLGDEVFGESHARLQWTNGGAYAEYAVVPVNSIVEKPPSVTFEQAACIPSSGYIALTNLQEGDPVPGKHILINGAGGGVGSLAVQMAKSYDMHVTAVDCANKLEMLRELGADQTIDYQTQDFTQGQEKYDLILDVVSNLTIKSSRTALKPDGKYVRIGHEHYGTRGTWFGSLPTFFLFMFMSPFVKQFPDLNFDIPKRKDVMEQLARLLELGQLTPRVDRIFPLEEAALAIRYLINGQAQGKILIQPH
jgi:NADPH:quinone reductase-like Zn-dependent oxidoreductase